MGGRPARHTAKGRPGSGSQARERPASRVGGLADHGIQHPKVLKGASRCRGSRAWLTSSGGSPGLRDQRDQQPRRTPRSSPDCTATATPRRIDRCSAGCFTRIDKRTGKIRWERDASRARRARSATSSRPTPTPRRRPTAASSSPGSARRACMPTTVNGGLLWTVDLGASNMGAYDIPTYEWGRPARRSSGTTWSSCSATRRPIRSCSRSTPRPARRSGRPSATSCRRGARRRSSDARPAGRAGHERVELHPRLRPAHRRGAVAARRQLEDHRADADLRRRRLLVVASGRAPETSDLRVRPARAATSRCDGQDEQRAQVAWSKTGRGSYMPTPLVYRGHPLRAANNGVLDAYDLATGGEEIYRQRLRTRAAASAPRPSPRPASIYLSNEDGDIEVPGRQRRRRRRLRGLTRRLDYLAGARRHLRLAAAVLSVAEPRQRLRRRRLLRRPPEARLARRLRRVHEPRRAARHPRDRRSRRQPHVDRASVVPAARSDPQSPFRDWYVWSEEAPDEPQRGHRVSRACRRRRGRYDRRPGEYYFHRFYDFSRT